MRAVIYLFVTAAVAVLVFLLTAGENDRSLLIEDARAMSHGGALVGVTLTIRNTGAPDRLVSAHVPDAKMAIVKGENAQPLPIPARSTVSLSMEGAHIMLGGVPGEMTDGRLITLILTFENAGEINAKARFGTMMAGMDHGAMNHGDMGEGAMETGAMMVGSDYIVPEDEVAPALSLTAEPGEEGTTTLRVQTENFTFSREEADGPHRPGIGHGHLYVGGVKLGRVYDGTAIIPPLPAGAHTVRVTLNTNDHRVYVVDGEPVTATVVVGE